MEVERGGVGQTVGDSPIAGAPEHDDRVFNSIFRADEAQFMASDSEPDKPLAEGANFAMFLSFQDSDRQSNAFEALSAGGRVLFLLDGGFGMVEDQHKVRWILAMK